MSHPNTGCTAAAASIMPVVRKPSTFPMEPCGVTALISKSRLGRSTPCKIHDKVMAVSMTAAGNWYDPTMTSMIPALTSVAKAVAMRGP